MLINKDIKRIRKQCYEIVYVNKSDNLKADKFLENTTYQISLGRTRSISITEFFFFLTKSSEKETPGPDDFTGELHKKIFKEEIALIWHKWFREGRSYFMSPI